MNKTKLIFCVMFLLMSSKISAQSVIDVSVGASLQDRFLTNVAYRYAKNDKFRIGLEAQLGSVKYRLIDAKPFTAGNVTHIGIPFTLRMNQKDQIRMDFYAKPGIRLQGKSNTNGSDSATSSTAFSFDGGLLLTVLLNKKSNLQSGVTFPLYYQINPSPIFENIFPGLLNFGGNYIATKKLSVFAKSAFGGALGGSGDTQKFGWSIQTGVRFTIGKTPATNFVEPSF
jgi:hypothetical protein